MPDDAGAGEGPVTEADVFSADEMRRAFAAADPGRSRTLILTGYLTGARPAELLALRWSDLDAVKDTLNIR